MYEHATAVEGPPEPTKTDLRKRQAIPGLQQNSPIALQLEQCDTSKIVHVIEYGRSQNDRG